MRETPYRSARGVLGEALAGPELAPNDVVADRAAHLLRCHAPNGVAHVAPNGRMAFGEIAPNLRHPGGGSAPTALGANA